MSRKQFTVDARTILTLGRDSIKDHTTALVELVKNSYDADASVVEIEIMINVPEPYIRVADNGQGMTEQIVDNQWLRIGFSDKTTHTVSKRNRRRTGEKGIGRISADRLGAILELHTVASRSKPFGLSINWDDFDVKGKALDHIDLDVLSEFSVNVPEDLEGRSSESGTELIIKKLRQNWTPNDIETLDRELSVLISPFSKSGDFNINIKTDVVENYKSSVGEQINENYVIRLEVEYRGPDKDVIYNVITRENRNSNNIESNFNISLDKFITLTDDEKSQLDFRFGPIKVTLIFYLLKPDIVEGTKISVADLRRFLKENSGIAIYRDLVRVKPYGIPGAPEWDWLSLGRRVVQSPAGPSRSGFRIGPNQIVGAVFVSRDRNNLLIDSSSREGLIQGPAFLALRRFVLGCVTLLENQYRIVFAEKKSEDEIQQAPAQEVRALGQELQTLKQDLRSIRRAVPARVSRDVEKTIDKIELITGRIADAQRSIEELASQNTIYRGLASLGIASSVFSHETQLAIGALTAATNNAKRFLEKSPPKTENAIKSMNQTIRYAEKIASWGSFALDRIRRDKRKRRKVNIRLVVLDVINHLRPAMDSVSINLQDTELEDIETRTFVMDVEAVILNLLTNAYTACKQKSSNRIIRIEVKREQEKDLSGYAIIVSDSGPGVDKAFRDQIWSPLFTTKKTEADYDNRPQSGTGLGLVIIDSVVNDLGGSRSVDTAPELGGARFRIWFPIQER